MRTRLSITLGAVLVAAIALSPVAAQDFSAPHSYPGSACIFNGTHLRRTTDGRLAAASYCGGGCVNYYSATCPLTRSWAASQVLLWIRGFDASAAGDISCRAIRCTADGSSCIYTTPIYSSGTGAYYANWGLSLSSSYAVVTMQCWLPTYTGSESESVIYTYTADFN